MKVVAALLAFSLAASAAAAEEPDGLTLPPGFHASVVADGLTGVRHLAVRANGDIYASTRSGAAPSDIIALHIGPGGKADRIERFGAASGGTGIRFYKGALYVSSMTAVSRFDFTSDDLLPAGPAKIVMDGMPTGGQINRMLAFDGAGSLYVSISGSGNICVDPKAPKVGLDPCPGLISRGGVWRFDAEKLGQKLADSEQLATGIRDVDSFDWRAGQGLFLVMHDRNGTSAAWPDLVSSKDEDAIAEEMHHIVKGVNLGWPYTYYDRVRNLRLVAPEYGGDGKTPAKANLYDPPFLALEGHQAPLDMLFYTGRQFPAAYRGGAFIAMHGGNGAVQPGGHNGYDIVFLPFDAKGGPGKPQVFADGFAGPSPESRNVTTAAYRPTGLAVGPDGSLYVADSQKGRLWRIAYTGR